MKIGVAGIGRMGAAIAERLLATGETVYVWNRTARPTPNFLASPADVADSAEIVQIFVSDGSALMQVLEALALRLTPRPAHRVPLLAALSRRVTPDV